MPVIRKRIILAVLCCVILCGLAVSAMAATQRITIGQTVTVTADKTGDAAVELYAFTPEETGTYVLYLSSGAAGQVRIGVLNTAGSGYLSRGTRRCVLEAYAGQTYWFEIQCDHEDGSPEREFTLDKAAPVESISLSVTEYSGVAGEELLVDVIYTPLNAVAKVNWSAEPAGTVGLSGNDGSCRVSLETAGTATVTAVSDSGAAAQCVVEIQEMPLLSAGQTTIFQAPAGSGVDGSRTYRFVPEKDGTYQFSVEPSEQVLLYVQGPDTGWDGDQEVRFEAAAGESYLLTVYYWGDHLQTVEYTLSLLECPPMEGFLLDAGGGELRAGDTCYISLVAQPQPCLTESVKWTVSDPSVARIDRGSDQYAYLKLHKAGKVTVTAVSASGKTDSIVLTVLAPRAPIALLSGQQNAITLNAGEIVQVAFAPEESGYYCIGTDHRDARVWMDGDATPTGAGELLWLEAGEICEGQLHNLSNGPLTFAVSVEKREVLAPVELEISKAPDNTTFLRGTVHYLRGYRLLSGLELLVTWSDGSQSVWHYDSDPMYLGADFIDYSIVDHGDGTGALELSCGGVTVSCPLVILDLTAKRIELVDSSPIRVVERSCGASEGGRWVYAANVYLNRQVRITFSDGSAVTAWPGEAVYGIEVETYDNQDEHLWVRGQENIVEYFYDELRDFLDVQIVESGVDHIELVSLPKTSICYGDHRYFYDYGYDRYFSPTDLRDFLGGLSLNIYYTDGTSKTVWSEDIQWITVMGQEYPYVDGYPLGYFGEAVNGQASVTGACEMRNQIEYMGASVEYTVQIVEENVPGMGDGSLLPALLLLLCLPAVVVIKKKM